MEVDAVISQLVWYSSRHTDTKGQFAAVAAKYLGLRKELGRLYEGMLSDPILQEIVETARLEIACGWRPAATCSTIYTDGCCLNNGRDGARAGYGVHIVDHRGDVLFSKGFRLDEKEPQTNQRAELTAMLYALNYASTACDGNYKIYTDSKYAIDCIIKWGGGWEASGWLKSNNKPVLHSDLIISAYKLYKTLGDRITICHIESHTGLSDAHSRGNAIADRLARNGAAS